MPGGNPGIPEAESGNFIWSRRDLLSLAGWGAILTCFALAGAAILRLLFPRVLFEPPTSFKAGYPVEYTVGDVSEKWMKSQRVWIVRTQNTLYALLGYTPRDLGSLFGRPLFADHDSELTSRRRDSFLIASSYGAVYGMLRDNGRLMYVVDTVDGREYAFDFASMPGERIEVTQTMTNENRRMIQEELTALAALYHYQPERP